MPQNRKPKGSRDGGQYDTGSYTRGDNNGLAVGIFSQPAPEPTWGDIDARLANINNGDPVRGAAWRSLTNPNSRAGINTWWATHFVTAEHAGDVGDVPKMPDDYGSTATGRSLQGNRRVHRMNYSGAGVSLRMPSATKIREFQQETAANGNPTFDVPIELGNEDGSHPARGSVRLTRQGDRWKATPLGFGGDHQRAGEAVEAVLEGRRVTTALDEIGRKGGLDERARDRARQSGTKPGRVTSSFIQDMAYDDASQTAFVNIRGDLYAYHCDRDTYQQVTNARSPGSAYNRFLKNTQPRRTDVAACDSCGAYSFGGDHQCTVEHAERQRQTDPAARRFTAAARSLIGQLRPSGR